MKLKFINPESLDKNLKATVHKTGKLGFTVEAAKKLELSIEKSVAIAFDEENKNDKNFYVLVFDKKEPDKFKVSRAGGYYYINTKALFDTLKYDYINDSIVYDIHQEKIENKLMYVFKRRDL